MWWTFLLKLVTNPKNLIILLLSISLIVSGGYGYYFKQKATTLQAEVKVLKVDNENLKAQVKQANDHNSALRKQIEELKTIEKTSKDLQKRLDVLKKKCSQTITIKKPTTPTKPEVLKPEEGVKPRVDAIPLPPAVKPREETKGESPKDSEKEVVDYEWLGPEGELEAIKLHNDIIEWFNKKP